VKKLKETTPKKIKKTNGTMLLGPTTANMVDKADARTLHPPQIYKCRINYNGNKTGITTFKTKKDSKSPVGTREHAKLDERL
jgi:hypothetical protein